MGGGKKSKAPDAPNYEALAKQQSADSYKIAKDITAWNRPTQTDQYGNRLSWKQDGAGNWAQSIALNPSVALIQNQDINNRTRATAGVGNNLAIANAQGQFKAGALPTYDESNGRAVSDALYNSVMNRALPQQAKDSEALRTQLRQQGLQPGTQAYDDSMRNLMTAQGDVAAQAANQATIGGYDEARQRYLAQLQGNAQGFGQKLAAYNQPYQNAAALQALSGGAVNPTFSGFSGATGYNPADMLGAANAGYQAQMGGVNSSNSKKGSMLGSGLGFAGSMMGGK